MTPADFHAFAGPTAEQVHAGTGIAAICLEAQWANETDWGNVVVGNNLGNIRCSPTSFCHYATLSDFAQDAIAVWHQTAFINNTYPNGFDPFRAACVGSYPADQLQQICDSPWSSGHYGGSLTAFYEPLEALPMALDPNDPIVQRILHQMDVVGWIWKALGIQDLTGQADISAAKSQVLADIQTHLDAIEAEIKALPGGGGTEPPEPAEPKTITLNIPSVPGTATGTIS